MSQAAVSFALNDLPGVSAGTRDRIRATARELGWTPSARARALSRSRSLAVGLVLSRPPELLSVDPFFPTFIAGVESVLARHGYACLLQMVGYDSEAEADVYRRLAAEGRVDGVILTDLRYKDPRLELVAELGLKAVAVGPAQKSWEGPSVAMADGPAVEDAVAHLVEHGHTRIAHVGGIPGYVHTASRKRAWRRALKRAGLEPGPVVSGDFTGPGGADATKQLLDESERPTAIVYANDLMAIGGLGVAQEAGLRIPRDLSVVGFDNVQLGAHLVPPLTTIHQDVAGWGRACAATLIAHIEDKPLPDIEPETPRLIVRGSTGRVRKEKT